jgi:hypothetical protein
MTSPTKNQPRTVFGSFTIITKSAATTDLSDLLNFEFAKRELDASCFCALLPDSTVVNSYTVIYTKAADR